MTIEETRGKVAVIAAGLLHHGVGKTTPYVGKARFKPFEEDEYGD